MTKITTLTIRGFLSLSLLAATTAATAGDFKPMVRMNLDFGGDQIGTVIYTNGKSTDLKAGQLLTFSGGVLYRPVASNYAVETTIGYKFDKANATNGTAEFTRIPLDLVASYRKNKHRFGGGFTYHMNPKFTCDLASVCAGSVTFSNALGAIVQYAYGVEMASGSIIDFGVRYTSIKYEANGGGKVDGSALGFFTGFAF